MGRRCGVGVMDVRLHDQPLNEDGQAAQEGGQPVEAFSSVPLEGAARNQASTDLTKRTG
jgi:hypothetical protein